MAEITFAIIGGSDGDVDLNEEETAKFLPVPESVICDPETVTAGHFEVQSVVTIG